MNCDIIKDLLPLYIEKLTSEPSNDLIEEHIKNCEDCKKTLYKLQEDIIIDNKETEHSRAEGLPETLIKRIRKNIYERILIVVSLTFILGILIGIFSTKMFMFIAFIGSISIFVFTIAIILGIYICRKKYSLRKQFKVLGNWVFAFSILICLTTIAPFLWCLNSIGNIYVVLILELLFSLILTLTLRIYAKVKLPKDDIVDTENPLNKKLFIVTFITLIFIVAIIMVPVTLFEANKKVDNVNLPFVNDSDVLGKWTAVDFVRSPELFTPNKQFNMDELFLKEIMFVDNGKMSMSFVNDDSNNVGILSPFMLWTKGYVLNIGGDHTASKYIIRYIDGSKYMFFEWKNGDYIYFHTKPSYYVLKKEANK